MLLIVPFDVPEGEDAGLRAAWAPVAEALSARRGHLGARLLRGSDARLVAVVHWSSPLMYARALREDGDLIAALPYPAQPALYVRA